jgi:hypothetical protein
MMSWLRRLDRYWRAPMPPERLAVLRLLVGTYAFVYVVARLGYLTSYASFDPRQFEPVGTATMLSGPLEPEWVYGLVVATVLLAPAFLLGWRFRITGPLFAGLLLWVLSYANSWGQILHVDNLMVLQVIVLALAPSADALSFDARRHGLEPRASPAYGWAVRLLCVAVVLAYVLAGVAKLKNGGLAFVEGETLRNYVAYDNLRKLELGSIHSPVGAWLLPYPGVFSFLAVLTLLLELGAPVALVHRRLAAAWCVAMWGFHLGVLVIMAIAFIYPLTGLAFAPFFRVERLLDSKLARRWRPRRALGSQAETPAEA